MKQVGISVHQQNVACNRVTVYFGESTKHNIFLDTPLKVFFAQRDIDIRILDRQVSTRYLANLDLLGWYSQVYVICMVGLAQNGNLQCSPYGGFILS